MNKKLRSLLVNSAVVLSCVISTPCLADGMPFKETKPEPILTPLDKALSEQETKEAPVNIVPPVPESRVVEVQPDASFFGLSVGLYDPFTHGEQATAFNLEYQPGVKIAGILQPIFGAMVATNGSMMGYGGVGVPINLGEHVKFMPSVAVGAYKKGAGVDLHNVLTMRTGAELAYQFDDKSRLGLNFHVLTGGGSWNRENRTEVIGLTYTVPLGVPKPKIPEQTTAAAR